MRKLIGDANWEGFLLLIFMYPGIFVMAYLAERFTTGQCAIVTIVILLALGLTGDEHGVGQSWVLEILTIIAFSITFLSMLMI